MKCDELIIYLPQDGPWGLYNEETGTVEEETCYLKSDVDEAIAELKAKLEDANATAYAESVDAGMRERRLKHALWLARAERASIETFYWLNLMYDEKWSSVKFTVKRKHGANVKPRQTTRTPEMWFYVWDIVELYCKHKAEDFK